MKTRFTLTFVVDLPYPDESLYPDCSTSAEAIALELRSFENDPYLWLETELETTDDYSLQGVVLDGTDKDTLSDTLNTKLTHLCIAMAALDDNFDVKSRDRSDKLRAEYDKTYTELMQLRNNK